MVVPEGNVGAALAEDTVTVKVSDPVKPPSPATNVIVAVFPAVPPVMVMIDDCEIATVA